MHRLTYSLLTLGLCLSPAVADNDDRHFRNRGNLTIGLGNWGGFNGMRIGATYDLLGTKAKPTERTSLGFYLDSGVKTPGSLILTQTELMREPQRAVSFQGGGLQLERHLGSLYTSAGLGRYFVRHFIPYEDTAPDPIISGLYSWGVRYTVGVRLDRFLFQVSATRLASPPTERRARNTVYAIEIGGRY